MKVLTIRPHFFFFWILLLFAACKNSDTIPDGGMDGIPMSRAWLTFFNMAMEAGDVQIVIQDTIISEYTALGKPTEYIELSSGEVNFKVLDQEGNELLNDAMTLTNDFFHSAFFYQKKSGDFELIYHDDYDAEAREKGYSEMWTTGVLAVPITDLNIYHLSLIMPNSIDVYDLYDYSQLPYVLMKASNLGFGNMANEIVEATRWDGTLSKPPPTYAVWDSRVPEFASTWYKNLIFAGPPTPSFNAHLPYNVPAPPGRNEVFIQNFSRSPRSITRGGVYAMVFYDDQTTPSGHEVLFLNLHDIAVKE